MIVLNRKLITGEINIESPICVIQEILISMGICYDKINIYKTKEREKVIDYLNNFKSPSIDKENWKTEELKLISRFVNPNVKWGEKILKDAFNFLINYIDSFEIPNLISMGQQTPENPYSVNNCILYKLCIKYDIKINSETSSEEMFRSLKIINSPFEIVKISLISRLSRSTNYNQIFEILESPDKLNFKFKKVVSSSLDKLYNKFISEKELRDMVIPSSNSEAISLSALNYCLDISNSNNPIYDYFLIKNGLSVNFPSLESNFNSIFPKSYYNENSLKRMVKAEGFADEEINSSNYYDLMMESRITNNFYHGIVEGYENKETPFQNEDLDFSNNNIFISFGIIDESVIVYTYKELYYFYSVNNKLTAPNDNNCKLTKQQINKLILLCDKYNVQFNFKNIINKILLLNDSLLINTAKLLDFDNNIVYQIFNKLLLVIMAIRGHKDNEIWPIEETKPVDNSVVEIIVCKRLSELEEFCLKYQEIYSLIKNLLLFDYDVENQEFKQVTNVDHGFTIGGKIDIVLQGENIDTRSCIRVSSNILSNTCCYHMKIMGFIQPFDPNKLRRIY